MISQLKSFYTHTLVYELEESISEYEIEVIDKGIASALKDTDKVNLMLYINVQSETLASFIKEFQVGIKYWNKIGRIAYIGNRKKWGVLVAIDNFFTKFKEKYFDITEVDYAWEWIVRKQV